MRPSTEPTILRLPSFQYSAESKLGAGAYLIPLLSLFSILFSASVVIAEIRFEPFIIAGYTYTDNVDLEPDDEEYDLITTVSPGGALTIQSQRVGSTIAYSPTYANYSRFPENTTWRHEANFDGWAEITRGTRLELANAFLLTEDPISDDDTTLRQSREPYFTNTTTAGIINRFGAEDRFELRYEYYVLENEDDTVEDSAYQRPSLLVTYWLSPNRYSLEAEGAYTVSDFDDSEDYETLDARLRLTRRFDRRLDVYVEYTHERLDYVTSTGDQDYQVYSPTIGFAWTEQANTRLLASFGYFYRDNESMDDDDGIVGDVEMAYTYSMENTLTLSGSVGYDRSGFDAENLGFSNFYELGADVSHRLTRRLTATLESSYRGDTYVDETPNREDITRTVGAGVTFVALPWMQFDLTYLHRNVDSTEDSDEYTENRGAIFVRIAPRQPLRF